jgi:hypothetical protein
MKPLLIGRSPMHLFGWMAGSFASEGRELADDEHSLTIDHLLDGFELINKALAVFMGLSP